MGKTPALESSYIGSCRVREHLGHTQYLWSPQTPPISGSVDSKPRPSFPFLQPRRVQTQCLHSVALQATPAPATGFELAAHRPGSSLQGSARVTLQCLPRNASSQPRTRLHVPCTRFPAPPTTSPTMRVSAPPPRFWALTCTPTGPDPAAAALQTSSQGSQAAAPALKGQALSPNKGGQRRALARPLCSSFYRHGEPGLSGGSCFTRPAAQISFLQTGSGRPQRGGQPWGEGARWTQVCSAACTQTPRQSVCMDPCLSGQAFLPWRLQCRLAGRVD